MDRITRLELNESARELLTTYCESLDTGDSKLLYSILHPEVVLQRSPGEPVEGREDVFRFFLAALENKVESRRHFVTNATVKILNESAAHVGSYLFALHYDKGQLGFAWGEYQLDVTWEKGQPFIKGLVIGLDMPISPISTMLGDNGN